MCRLVMLIDPKRQHQSDRASNKREKYDSLWFHPITPERITVTMQPSPNCNAKGKAVDIFVIQVEFRVRCKRSAHRMAHDQECVYHYASKTALAECKHNRDRAVDEDCKEHDQRHFPIPAAMPVAISNFKSPIPIPRIITNGSMIASIATPARAADDKASLAVENAVQEKPAAIAGNVNQFGILRVRKS